MAYGLVEQKCHDDKYCKYLKWIKKAKHRAERRKAKRDIEIQPTYRKYYGYSS